MQQDYIINHQSSIFNRPLSALYICREPSTNQLLFMQNKPNFQDTQMNVNIYITMNYEKFIPLAGQKNKPNSKPIKPNFQKAKMNVNSLITKDYRKKDDFVVRINKPNFRNAQNERKLTYHKGLQKKRCFSVPKNKPKQSQFHLPQRGKTEVRCRFSEVRYLSSVQVYLPPFLAQIQGYAPKIRKKPEKPQFSPILDNLIV